MTTTLLRHLNPRRVAPELVLLREDGVIREEVPASVPARTLRARRLRWAWMALARLLRDDPPDILLSMSTGGNSVAALAHLLARSRARLVLSERTTYTARWRWLAWVAAVAMRTVLYRRADAIIAVSERVKAGLVRLGLHRDRIVVVTHPIVDDRFWAQAILSPPHPWFGSAVPVILAVGRLHPAKDYPALLEAFAQIRRRRQVRLVVLGEGALRPVLEAQTATLGITADVDFAGFVANPLPFMRACTVYVLSSRYEGLPGALMEAMACGAAVVATDCPSGPAELIRSEVNGLLVPVGAPGALARAVERLLDDPALRRRLGQEARRSAEGFSAAAQAARYEQVLLG